MSLETAHFSQSADDLQPVVRVNDGLTALPNLFLELLEASEVLASRAFGEGSICAECQRGSLSDRAIEHAPSCRTGRVLTGMKRLRFLVADAVLDVLEREAERETAPHFPVADAGDPDFVEGYAVELDPPAVPGGEARRA